MLMLASDGFGFASLRDNAHWSRVASWFDHVPWEGAVFWDMIQPAFMVMVGVALPFAMARRSEASHGTTIYAMSSAVRYGLSS